MKLCKDCKHALLPQPPWANVQVGQKFTMLEMCGHPNAARSVVDGSLKTPCEIARGATGGPDPICGMDAALFEQREPDPEITRIVVGQWVVGDAPPIHQPWWRSIFGG
jgi:hypothetical protein